MLDWLRSPAGYRARLTIALFLVFVAGAYLGPRALFPSLQSSQPPVPSALEKSTRKQSPASHRNANSGYEGTGSEQRPFVVKTISAPETQSEAANDAVYQQQRAADNHVVEIGIGAIIVGGLQTAGLFFTFLIMRKTAIRQLRAYLAAEPKRLLVETMGNEIRSEFVIRNYGETPAYRVRYLAGLMVLPFPLRVATEILVPQEGLAVPDLTLHKNGEQTGDGKLVRALTDDDIAAATGPNHRLYLVGTVFYRDAFRIERKTKFAAYLEPEGLQAAISGRHLPPERRQNTFSWILSPVHNDST